MPIDRRTFLGSAALMPLAGALPRLARAEEAASTAKADYTLRIANGLVELAPDHIVSTTLYNGQFPGPLLRFREGQSTVIDIYNDTDTPELVHWHGQTIPSDVDGAAEEGSPFVPAHGMRRISFSPKPSGFRFYHTHVAAGSDLNRGTYTGQAGPVYIEPRNHPGAYDREVFLVLKEFAPAFSRGGDMAMDALVGAPVKALQDMGAAADGEAKDKAKGFEVGYSLFAINGRMLGHGEPIRVKQGERVLFHVLKPDRSWRAFAAGRPGRVQRGQEGHDGCRRLVGDGRAWRRPWRLRRRKARACPASAAVNPVRTSGSSARTTGGASQIQLDLMNIDALAASVDVSVITEAGLAQADGDTGITVPPYETVTESLSAQGANSPVVAVEVRTSIGRVAADVWE